MKTTLLLFAGLITSLAHAQTFEYLDINQVKARVNSGGDLHWDPTTGNSGYECPKGSGKMWSGAANLWVGGLDVGGQLKLSAQTYRQGGADFWPGPLNLATATTNSATVNQYNRVWKLNKTDIDDFITNFANGNVQNGSFIPAADLLSWPGNGDISQNQDVLLAPFADLNGDNIYDPIGAGEYPLIKGDQAIFTIFNDSYLPHGSGGQAIGLEIRLMAYAYGTGTLVANNPFLNYTTFYNYSIINRSSFSLYNAKIGLFNDSDIGNFMDDYVGSDAIDSYAYTYNAPTSTVTNEPAIGITQTKGPINTTDGIDNDNDGMVDEPFENMNMTNFMYFNNSFPSVPLAQTDPSNATEYFNYLNSYWKDGTPLTCGGNGYGGTGSAIFAYPANSILTTGFCGGIPWSESGNGSDKKFVMSSGPSILQPGSFNEVEYAYIASFDSITNNPIQNLDSVVHALRTMNSGVVTTIKKQTLNHVFTISPNPTNALLTINSGKVINGNVKIEVIDALGKILIAEDYKEFNQSTINVSTLSSGIYFVKISSGDNATTKKFIKE